MDKEVNTGEDKIYTEKEHQGLIKDTQRERADRQQAQFELDQSKRKLESLEQTVKEMKEKSLEKTELVSDNIKVEGKDDDYATVKDVKLGFKSLEKEATAKFKAAQKAATAAAEQEGLKIKFDESCQKAITKYTPRKDIGLDFQTVYRAAVKLIGRNKYEEMAIFHSANPGEALYKKGSEDPEIKAKLDLEENQELLKDMGNRKVDKTSLGGGVKVKSDEFYSPREIIDMTPTEAKENLPKIEKSMAHWEELRKQKK